MKVVLNSIKVKQLNTELVRNALRKEKYGTKKSIAIETGLSVATCRNILVQLLSTGEVSEVEFAPSTGGRPSKRFIYNENFAYILIIFPTIETNKNIIFSAVCNMTGKIINSDYSNKDDITLNDIEEVIAKNLKEFPAIEVVSLGIPGVVEEGNIEICDLHKLNGINIESRIFEEFKLKTALENDVNAAALGYYRRIEEKKPESLVYLFFPEKDCAGAGIVINGRVLKGATNFAGEVSYLPIYYDKTKMVEDLNLYSSYIVKTILTVNCIINPNCIVISGKWITEKMQVKIVEQVVKQSHLSHIPVLDFEKNMNESYIDGLKYAGFQKLSCDIRVEERS